MSELINDISNFTNVDFGEVRVLMDENDKPWFFGVDVCKALGYASYKHAIRNTVDEEYVGVYEKGYGAVVMHHVPNRMQEPAVCTLERPGNGRLLANDSSMTSLTSMDIRRDKEVYL